MKNLNLIIDAPMILSGYLASFLTEEDTQYLLKQINAATPFPLRKEQVLVGTYGQYTQAAGAALYYVETFLNTKLSLLFLFQIAGHLIWPVCLQDLYTLVNQNAPAFVSAITQ